MNSLEFCRCVVCHYLETHGHPPEPGRRGRTLRSVTLTHVIIVSQTEKVNAVC
jgi:hypothetical protein